MTELAVEFDEHLLTLLEEMAQEGVQNAAEGLSVMIGETINFSQPAAKLVPLQDIPHMLGGPESEAVGIYLLSEGDLAGQIMLVLPFDQAFELVDLVLEQPAGTTSELGSFERSALAEIGNLTGSFFLNAIAEKTGLEARPSPPAVMVDMVGAILGIVVATAGGVSDHVLVLQANLTKGGQEVQAQFWVIPNPGVLEAISSRGIKIDG